jgi:proteasome lid subunit RPN8/RPN11
MPDSIRIIAAVLRALRAEAQQVPERECCGLLAGRDGRITRAYPARNAASDPATQYEMAPEVLFQLMREMRGAGLQLLGIYHSHPHGANEPSRIDIVRAYYPDAAYFIISPLPNAENPVRAFTIRDGSVSELRISVV